MLSLVLICYALIKLQGVSQYTWTDPYQVACNDHLVFGELDILRDPETLEQPLGLFLGLKLLFSGRIDGIYKPF